MKHCYDTVCIPIKIIKVNKPNSLVRITNSNFLVYPNPVSNILLYIDLKEFLEEEMRFYTITGKLLMTKKLRSKHNTISLEYPAGTYILTLTNKSETATYNIIIE